VENDVEREKGTKEGRGAAGAEKRRDGPQKEELMGRLSIQKFALLAPEGHFLRGAMAGHVPARDGRRRDVKTGATPRTMERGKKKKTRGAVDEGKKKGPLQGPARTTGVIGGRWARPVRSPFALCIHDAGTGGGREVRNLEFWSRPV